MSAALPLAHRFLAGRGLSPGKLSSDAEARLLSHPWPANARELENPLERAIILAGEGVIRPEHLGPSAGPRARNVASELLAEGFNLDAFERELLHAALARAGGNKSAAARLLGITRRRSYSRLESLDQPGDTGQ
jgi:two-component system response regulator HydG